MTRLYRRFFYTFTALFLIGCSTLPPEPQSVEWQAHRQQLESLTQYTANGKLGYISPDQRQTLNFHWTYSANLTQVRLTTFLGQTVFNLTSTPNGAFIETYDDQKLSGQDANLLIYQLTGLNIPIEQLAGWLIGLPTNTDTYQLNDLNTVASLSKELNQTTWALNYTEYRAFNVEDTERTLPMPTRMQMVQDDTKLNLVVSKWTIKQ
ncbi:outer membrane lipoprotein LolB [Vibrio variabilis]|uniref:Outer-membrane lipoprotein LolB n=1 Tax=Vibrio variabilis TaxID=990271 RepID=A0ABQ0JSE8_9VIBR|nr:outer membrane lipoprotein LolB [Vibrio variabilis]